MPHVPTAIRVANLHRFEALLCATPNDPLILLLYHLAKRGMVTHDAALYVGVSPSTMLRWQQSQPPLSPRMEKTVRSALARLDSDPGQGDNAHSTTGGRDGRR